MNNQKPAKFLIIILAIIVSIIMAVMGSGMGFVFSFLLFGDGSELYFELKKALPMEPYALIPAIFSIVAFTATWVVAILILKRNTHKL